MIITANIVFDNVQFDKKLSHFRFKFKKNIARNCQKGQTL